MELKHASQCRPAQRPHLLIVPYGIETYRLVVHLAAPNELLIVPYGIET